MRRLVYVFVALLAMSAARAEALTIRDVVELTRAGLGDDVLLALIEVDPSVFPIDTETLKYLKESGVSQRVIVAMVRSARTPPPSVAPEPFVTQIAPQAQEPQVVVIDHREPERVREVPVAVPIYFPIVQRSRISRTRWSRRSRLRCLRRAGSNELVVQAGPSVEARATGVLGYIRNAAPRRLETQVSFALPERTRVQDSARFRRRRP